MTPFLASMYTTNLAVKQICTREEVAKARMSLCWEGLPSGTSLHDVSVCKHHIDIE
jgi:hypothetical protein